MITTENRTEEIKTEFNECTLMRIFEIEVTDQKGQQDYIIFDLSIDGDTFKAQHVGLTKEEEESKFIAFKSVDIDDCFSLDENLQELYSECINAILQSDFYTLND